ncbi:hypothetical protein [Paenibacillus sp. GCM10027626]
MLRKYIPHMLTLAVDLVYTVTVIVIILGIIMFSGDSTEFIYMKF